MQVTIIKKVKTDKGWKFEPVEFHGNGKIRPDPRPHTFYLDWYEDGKRKREAVGKFAPQAVARRDRKQHLLTSAALGIKAIDPDQPNGTPLKDATDAYLDDKQTRVVERTTGLLRVFDKDMEQTARQNAVDDIRRSARTAGILKDAEDRAQAQVKNLFRQMGFQEIEILSH